MIKGSSFTDTFIKLGVLIRDEHEYQSSPRGRLIKESLGIRFEIENPRDRLLYIPARNMSLGYTIAEALWYFLGNNETDWISYYSNFWKSISDDGITANSAYGARIFKKHPRVRTSFGENVCQWTACVRELIKDNDSRRAYIHIKSPLDNEDKLDVPCTIGMQFFIRDKKLHLLVNMRSSDLILGITYDIPAFTLMQEAMLLELQKHGLDVELGRYIHVSNSLHVYEQHFAMLDKIAATTQSTFGAMAAMPGQGDWQALNNMQKSFRADCESSTIDSEIANLGSYYSDWAQILRIHSRRVQLKATNKHDALATVLRADIARLRSELTFEGYRFFKK